MTNVPNEPEWTGDDPLELSLEKAHLLLMHNDYANALVLLTELSAKYPDNPDIIDLLTDTSAKLKEMEKERIRKGNPLALLCVWRNPFIFFIWMGFAIFLIGYGLMRDGYLLRDSFSMGIIHPIRIDVEWDQTSGNAGTVMGPGMVASWISWTAPIYANILLFTLVGAIGFLMMWGAWRDISRAPAWTDLEGKDPSSDSVWIRRIWWW